MTKIYHFYQLFSEHLDILFITALASKGNKQHYLAVIPISISAYKSHIP
jgi:hypothetical protein